MNALDIVEFHASGSQPESKFKSKSNSKVMDSTSSSVEIKIPQSFMKPSAPKAHDGKNDQENHILMSEWNSERKAEEEKSFYLLRAFLIGLGLFGVLIWVGCMMAKGGGSLGSLPSEPVLKLQEQISAFAKTRALEVSSVGDELEEDISLLNFGKNSSAPPPKLMTINTTAPPPTLQLTTPRFYYGDEFTGLSFQPSEGWETGCVNLPDLVVKRSESVDLGGHCLLLCPGPDCSRMTSFFGTPYGKNCTQLDPNSPGPRNFAEINYEFTVRSFRLCQKK